MPDGYLRIHLAVDANAKQIVATKITGERLNTAKYEWAFDDIIDDFFNF